MTKSAPAPADVPVEPTGLDVPDPGPELGLVVAERVVVAAYVGDAEVEVTVPAGPLPVDLPDALVAHLVAIGAAVPAPTAQLVEE